MLDRPVPFNDRLRATWPLDMPANPSIENALRALALAPGGSHRTDLRARAGRSPSYQGHLSVRGSRVAS